MATYKEVKGITVQTLDSDPVEFVGSWASQPTLNTTRSQAAGFGTASNMGAAGGNTGSLVTNFELWNGTSWTETTEINTARRNARGVGTYTEGLIFGGWHPPAGSVATEDWNGSAWTEVNDMTRPGARQSQASFGIYTAAIVAGGEPGTGSFQLVEKWDGTNWTEVNELNTGRQGAMGFGIVTSGFVISGYSPPAPPGGVVTNVESFDGTSFTETNDINSGRGAGGATGTTTAGITYGGQTPAGSNVTKTESWDGTNWTEVNDLSTGRTDGSWTPSPSSGSRSALYVDGGVPGSPGYASSAEEWSFPPTTTPVLKEGMLFLSANTSLKSFGKANAIPSATFSSAASMSTNRNFGGSAGLSADDNMRYGGFNTPGPTTDNTEIYNGTSWTEVNELNTSRAIGAGWGTTTASIGAGGFIPPSTNPTAVESWNGTSWSEVNEINNQHYTAGRGGVTQTAAVIFGGLNTTNTEVWNGTSFTEVNNMNTAGGYVSSFGTSISAIAGNRYQPGQSPAYTQNVVESWDGTSWTEVNEMNTARAEMQGFGASGDSGVIAGGSPNGSTGVANTEFWNGTSFTELADLSTARLNADQSPSAASGMVAGGYASGSKLAVAEEWNADLTLSTVTVS